MADRPQKTLSPALSGRRGIRDQRSTTLPVRFLAAHVAVPCHSEAKRGICFLLALEPLHATADSSTAERRLGMTKLSMTTYPYRSPLVL